MGRNTPKKVLTANDIDRRETGYYSTPDFVAEFFARRLLKLRPHAKFVLDPCIGQGEFTAPFKSQGCHVTGYDILDMQPSACDVFIQSDFLDVVINDDRTSLFHKGPAQKVDIIVANPPYNCHEVEYIRSQKERLIARFGKSSALNMYSLFIRAIIDFAADGCLIGLVTHDSFLTANGHKELRQYILDNCLVHNLHLCPTNLFLDQGADVRTCLLVLEKTSRRTGRVQVSNRPASPIEFMHILKNETFEEQPLENLLLNDTRDNSEFIIGAPSEITGLFSEKRIGELAPCVTGISTGDDKKYLRPEKSDEFAVPFYKNPASRNFYSQPDGYLCTNYDEVSRNVSNFMVRNRELIFRGGISCSSMGVKFGAAIRPTNTACGVNPNIIIEDERRWWLLSFLNSRLCLYLTRGIIIRGNMITAGYAARIPVPPFNNHTLQKLSELGMTGYKVAASDPSHQNLNTGNTIKEIKSSIDAEIENNLSFTHDTVELLKKFEMDPIRLT